MNKEQIQKELETTLLEIEYHGSRLSRAMIMKEVWEKKLLDLTKK